MQIIKLCKHLTTLAIYNNEKSDFKRHLNIYSINSKDSNHVQFRINLNLTYFKISISNKVLKVKYPPLL